MHGVPVLFPGQDKQLHVLQSGEFDLKLGLDHVAPLMDRRAGPVVRPEPHVVGLNDLVRVDKPVLRRQHVPAAAGQLGLGRGRLEQLGDVQLTGRRRALELLRSATDKADRVVDAHTPNHA